MTPSEIHESVNVLSPLMQYGFAGLSLVLIGIIVWLISRLLAVLESMNKVITANTTAVTKLNDTTDKVAEATEGLKVELLRRPCIARFEMKE